MGGSHHGLGAVFCGMDMRGLNAAVTVENVRLENIRLRALVWGVSCNSHVRNVTVANVTIAAPQQTVFDCEDF